MFIEVDRITHKKSTSKQIISKKTYPLLIIRKLGKRQGTQHPKKN